MSTPVTSSELIEHLCLRGSISRHEATRLVQEILAFYDESTERFIQRRHYELQKSGLPNLAIYEQIRVDLQHHRFVAQPFTVRQIRRTIYG